VNVCFSRQRAAEHYPPADRLNRGHFGKQFRACRCTASERRTHQPAAELFRSTVLTLPLHNQSSFTYPGGTQGVDVSNEPRLHWAPKVRQDKIRRLYEQDARGLLDDALLDDVGTALYSRCRSILLVSSQRLECPQCGHAFSIAPHTDDTIVACPTNCGWTITGKHYHQSWQHRDLIGTNTPAFQIFVDRYPYVTALREKMILIDQLLHAFHQSIRYPVPHRSAASNLIEGNHAQVVAFLDQLTYGTASTPDVHDTHAAWRETMQQMQRFRHSKPNKRRK
jgi:ribosomal protein L37AE/L43A